MSRRTLVQIHLWLGITIGFFWALQGLTGALLVFSRDIDRAVLGETGDGAVMPLDDIFAKAEFATQAKVTKLERFGPSPTLLLAYYDDPKGHQRTLVVDSRSGAVLDDRDPDPKLPGGGSTQKWLLGLHEALLLGDNGGILVGTSGMFLFSSLILGLIVAWPRRNRWKPLFAAGAWKTTLARLFGWHRMVGMIAGCLLLVTVPCGIYLAYAPEIRPILARTAGYRMPHEFKPAAADFTPRVSAEQAFEIAAAPFPGAQLVRAVKPTRKVPVYTFRLLQPNEPRRWAGTTTVSVDPVTGKVLDVYDPLHGPTANRVTDYIYHVHTGDVGRIVGRLLVFLAGLSLPTLYVLGLLLWFRKRKPRRTAAAAVPRPA